MRTKGCDIRMMACQDSIYYGAKDLISDRTRFIWGENSHARSSCLQNYDNFDYGAYKWTVQLVTNNNRLEKALFPIFWGLMTLRYIHTYYHIFEYCILFVDGDEFVNGTTVLLEI